MKSVLLNLFIGCLLISAFGELKFGLSAAEEAGLVLASNGAGLIALFVYTFLGRYPWTRRHIVGGPGRTWTMFLCDLLGSPPSFAPILRNVTAFGWFVIPVILTTGIAILILARSRT